MGKPKAPKAPPYDRMLEFAEAQAEVTNALTREFLDFQRDAFAKTEARADEFWDVQRPELEAAFGFAEEQRSRYRELGMPLEDELTGRLQDWASPARVEQNVAAAVGDVRTAADAERRALYGRLSDLGVDPSQVAATGLDRRMGIATTAQAAAAATGARRSTEAEGLDRLAAAANIYRGLPQVAAQSAEGATRGGSLGTQAGVASAQFGQTGYGQAANMYGVATQGVNQAFGVAGDIYKGQVAAYDTQLKNSPLNVLAGAAGTFLGRFPFASGIPVVPAEMSPSRGAVPDDVPAQISAGEAVLDADTVAWHGVKAVRKMMQEAQQGMATVRGVPA